MKRTEKINISGILFHIDEDAYERLTRYLKNLKKRFSHGSEDEEILHDIELRIAELLQLKLSESKQVIALSDIEEMIGIMGNPEDFSEADEEESSYDPQSHAQEPTKGTRRFYRDLDRSVIGGVCAGLGAHFGLDPVVLRVIFIILAFPLLGFTIIAYIVLWIAMPAALTTEEKMAMRGGNYRISDIEDAVKNEYNHVRDNFKDYKNSRSYKQASQTARSAGNGFVALLNFLGRFIAVLIGIAFILLGISLIFGIIVATFISHGFWINEHFHHLPTLLSSIANEQTALLAAICLVILVVLPIIALIYSGFKLILRFKTRNRALSIIGFTAWLLSLFTLIAISMYAAGDLMVSANSEQKLNIPISTDKTLVLTSSTDIDEFSSLKIFDEEIDVYSHRGNDPMLYLPPDFDIVYTDDESVSLIIEKKGHGANRAKANENVYRIVYNWDFKDTTLQVDPFYYMGEGNKWAFQDVEATLYVPEGQKIYFERSLRHTIDDVYMERHPGRNKLFDRSWLMTPEGLVAFPLEDSTAVEN